MYRTFLNAFHAKTIRNIINRSVNAFPSVNHTKFITSNKESVIVYKNSMDVNVINDTIKIRNNVKKHVITDFNG